MRRVLAIVPSLALACSTTNIYSLTPQEDAAGADVVISDSTEADTSIGVDSALTADGAATDSIVMTDADAVADSAKPDAPVDSAVATDTGPADTYVPTPEEARCVKHYPRLSWNGVDGCYDNGGSSGAAFFCVWRLAADGSTRCMPSRESQVYGYPSSSCSPTSLGFLNEKTVGATDTLRASVPVASGAWAAVAAGSVPIGSIGTWWLHGSCAKQFTSFPYYDPSTLRSFRSTVDFTDTCVADP